MRKYERDDYKIKAFLMLIKLEELGEPLKAKETARDGNF